MAQISKIHAREILDSRGNPTIEVEVFIGNSCGRVQIPSGASVGIHEAVELRDMDKTRYHGKGVLKAVHAVNQEIQNAIIGLDAREQAQIDNTMIELDGTHNKSHLGANAILGVSLAVAKAASQYLNLPLYKYLATTNKFTMPVPMINIINGGMHANNNLDIQEFMIIPPKTSNFREMIRKSAEVFYTLKDILTKNNHSINTGDEGGFAPNFNNNEIALDYLVKAIQVSGHTDFRISLDVAASTLYQKDKTYQINNNKVTYKELTEYYSNLCDKYPIISIEDGMDEQDIEGWKYLTETLGRKIQLVGDDIFVTNPNILEKGIKNKIANAILIKPNQIGTLTETLNTMHIAQKNKYKSVMSHRSGETEDTTIAHIAVATNCGQIKTGSLSRSERVAKYNELIRIEETYQLSQIHV